MTRAALHDVDAVILAGGRGTRLHPHTRSTPKALLQLGGRPIIDILLAQLAHAGVPRVHVALGHLAERLAAHFARTAPPTAIELCLAREERPLGTVGPLARIAGLRDTILLINGDLLTALPFAPLVAAHRAQGCPVTVAVSRRTLPVPFGVVERTPAGRLAAYREKPALEIEAAMGISVLARHVIERLPAGRAIDLPELLDDLLAAGEPVATYVSDAYWTDIGCAEDYARAARDFAAEPQRFLPAAGARRAHTG